MNYVKGIKCMSEHGIISAQLEMSFAVLPGFRPTDGNGSRKAARRVRESGGQMRQWQLILRAMRTGADGLSSKDMARAAGMDRYMVARRMPELERLGYVRRGDETETGVAWWITEQGE